MAIVIYGGTLFCVNLLRNATCIGGEDGVDIKRTRNIGIIAHIDAVSIRICG